TDLDKNQFPSMRNFHDNDELYAAYFTLKSIKCMALDLYWIYVNGHGIASENPDSGASNSGASTTFEDDLYAGTTAYYHTFGARLGGTFNVACGLDYNVEAAFQTGNGKDPGVADVDIDNWTVEGELGLTFNKSNRFRVFARTLFAEGPDGNSTG